MITLADFAKHLLIDAAKLTEYALNPKNDQGQHKARVFKAVLGYTQANYQLLVAQIEAQAMTGIARIKRVDQYGHHLQVDLKIVGPNGQQAIVCTGWLVEMGSDMAKLITLYVKEQIQ